MFKQDSDKHTRALDRGLVVIETLARHGPTSLAGMRRATGLSNATLYRLLATLQERGWVRRNLVEGQYELAHSLGNLLGETSRADPLAEHAAPILRNMRAREVGLPSDVSKILAPGRIEISESTRLRGPMAPSRTSLGIRPSMLFSAHGRIILAQCSGEVREAHLTAIRQTGSKEENAWIDSAKLKDILAETRARGFGLREANYWVAPFDPSPELGAMAVTISGKAGVYGTLSVLWIQDDMSLEEVLDFGCLEDLQNSARRIALAMERFGIAPPRIT
jgi:IclR family mhp operon transcriptional activator